MINKIICSLVLLSFLIFCSSESLAIRMANVQDGAEEVLYGRSVVNSGFIQKVIEDIDQPETNFWLKQAPVRSEEEAEKILEKIIPLLQKEAVESRERDQVKERIAAFMKMNLSEYPKIPLSYLIERIYSEL